MKKSFFFDSLYDLSTYGCIIFKGVGVIVSYKLTRYGLKDLLLEMLYLNVEDVN
jgi:hypothetical protein